MAIDLNVGDSFYFQKKMFINNFQDADGDSPCEVILFGLPSPLEGILYYDGIAAKVGLCFPVDKANRLSFKRVSPLEIQGKVLFKVSDNNQNKQYSNMAIVTINIGAYVNMPPSQVGNLTVTMAHAATKTFSASDFTTGLSPVYLDPEGDAPSKVRVTGLPVSGTLKLNGVAVTLNQDILFSSIQSGLFTYVADQNNTAAINTTFTFAMSDVGSGQFTS